MRRGIENGKKSCVSMPSAPAFVSERKMHSLAVALFEIIDGVYYQGEMKWSEKKKMQCN